MSPQIHCPVHDCDYSGTLEAVITHVAANDEGTHSWANLEYRSETDFKISFHDERIATCRETATVAEDTGNYEEAIEQLERAIEHAQEAMACTDGTGTRFSTIATTLLGEVERVETVAATQQIDSHLTTAINELDAGDAAHVRNDQQAAVSAYTACEQALDRAAEVEATDVANQRSEIEEHRDRLQLRQSSLEAADTHRRVIEAINTAREHRDTGDNAFKDSEYQQALDAYQEARDAFSEVESSLENFEFGTTTESETCCDLCRETFETALISIQIDEMGSRNVCPACMHFAPDGVLPTPTELAAKQNSIKEMISNLKTGDYGLDWSTPPTTPTATSDSDEPEQVSFDEQELLMELIQVYQTVDDNLTAADLDAHTTHGFQAYKQRFGSLDEALQAAGFED